MKIKLLLMGLLLLAGLSLLAAEVTADMAARAVGNWRARKAPLGATLGRAVAESRRVERDGAKFNVVRLEGGGYVVTSADTSVRPVILFSEDPDFVLDEENPALALLVGELKTSQTSHAFQISQTSPASLAWAELLDDRPYLSVSSASKVTDVRVEPIVKAKWNQSTVTVGDEKKRCFNYYTPNNYVCGCVATAAGQIMRQFEWPRADVDVPSFTGKYCAVDDVATNLVAQAGYYNWSKMPYVPNSDATTLSQRQAIGKLVSDIGIAVGMDYSDDGSSATTYTVQYALTQRFGYSFVAATTKDAEEKGWEDYGRVMRANFDAGLPVQLSIRKNSGGGHSIVGDGYGYIDEQVYYHLNFGWSGSSNAWYAPPDIGKYDYVSGMVHNIYTNQSPSHVIASGRITDSAGLPVEGVTVWAENAKGVAVGTVGTSDQHGIYAIYVAPGDYRVVAHRDVVNEIGEVIAEIDGETTASPVACYSITAREDGGYNYKGTICVAGNASGCDIVTTRIDCGPKGTVAFSDAATVGADFARVTAHLGGEIVRFPPDIHSATLSVALYAGETKVGEQSVDCTELGPFAHDFAFEGLSAGTNYRLVATLLAEGAPLAEAMQLVTTARGETSTILSADELVMDVQFLGLYDTTTLADPPQDARAAVAGVRCDDRPGEFVVWSGSAWLPTGVAMTAGETYRVLVTRTGDRLAYYLVSGAGQIPLGVASAGSSAQPLAEVGVVDAAELVSFAGRSYDPNLIARADGAAKYATFADALAAQETATLTPLWESTGTVPDDAKLLVFSLLDPNGLLALTGGKLLKETVGPDGSVTRAYGTMDAEKVAASDYLKATMVLGLDEPLTSANEVSLGEVAVDDGALGFRVAVDGEPVTREKVTDYVQKTKTLAPAAWQRPSADEVEFSDGKVKVLAPFARINIPKD